MQSCLNTDEVRSKESKTDVYARDSLCKVGSRAVEVIKKKQEKFRWSVSKPVVLLRKSELLSGGIPENLFGYICLTIKILIEITSHFFCHCQCLQFIILIIILY